MTRSRYPRQAKELTILSFVICLLVWSCTGDGTRSAGLLPPSTGQADEILIICDSNSWKSNLGDSLKKCFSAEQAGLPESEPIFDIIHIIPRAFTDIFKTTSNIIILETDKNGKPGYLVKKDVWAKNQQVVRIVAKDQMESARIIGKSTATLRELFLKSGFRKRENIIKAGYNEEASEEIRKKLEVKVYIPSGFKKAKESQNAIYFRKDLKIGQHSVIMGLVIYRTKYSYATDLHMEELINNRDRITKELVKGSKNRFYMEVYRPYVPDTANREIAGNYSKLMRGLWRMNGEFMGGPFVNTTIVDEKRNELLVIDGFVYAPKFGKRKYVRELETVASLARLE